MRMNKMKIDGSKFIWRYKNLKFRGRDTMRIIKRRVDNKLKFRTTTELKIYFNLIMKKIRNRRRIIKGLETKRRYIIETDLEKDKLEAIKNFYLKDEDFHTMRTLNSRYKRLVYNHDVNKAIKRYLKQEGKSNKSIFFEERESRLENTDTPEDRMWSGGGINYIAEHEEVMSKLNREIETYGLEKLIIKVDEKTFFRNNYSKNYDKKTFVIEELESVPRLLKLNPGYNDLYMARSEDYKKLFMFAMFGYQLQYENMLNFYKVCSYLYPEIMPKISDDLFNRLLELAREREKQIWEEK